VCSLKNRFAVTFDDGYAHLYDHAFPLLKEMGIPFAVFVTTGMVDTGKLLWNDLLEFALFTTEESVLPEGLVDAPVELGTHSERRRAAMRLKSALKRLNVDQAREEVEKLAESLKVGTDAPELDNVRFLGADQIREMAEAGVAFGGHSVSHPILSRETRERVRHEVAGCKEQLEAILGKRINAFAYPNGQIGDFNDMVKDEVRRAGYSAALTAIRGLAYPGGDPLEIRRVMVGRWSGYEMETRASGLLEALRRRPPAG
jgi:peptidoglycan/xylan/chitin deacetylase (PgdA/CDA1 family)